MSYPPPVPPSNNWSPAQAPPPPPPQMAGPGGAYGPIRDTGAPYPGQPVQVGMTKPGTIKGIQAILWVFTALSALGNVAAAINLMEYFSTIGMVSLVVAAYFTVQSLISPIHIERGKRWAWIWSLISSILGLAVALLAIALSLQVGQVGVMMLIGVALGALYAVLLGLLLSPSARAWILMHRIQRGEVQMPPAGMDAASAQPERPERKPGVVTAAQALLAVLVLPVFLVPPQLVESFQHEADVWGYVSLSDYLDEHNLWAALIGAGIGGLVVLVVNSLITWGLGKGRQWARIFGAIWLGVTLVGMGIGAFIMGLLLMEGGDARVQVDGVWMDDTFEPVWQPVSFGALCLGTVLAIVAFFLLMARGTRLWTPGRPPSMMIVQQQMRY